MLVYKDGRVETTPPRAPLAGEKIWLHLTDPIGDESARFLQETLHCHPLAVEDVVHFGQRPKMDLYPGDHAHAFISFYALTPDMDASEFCILIAKDFIVTVTRAPLPWLERLATLAETSPETLKTTGWLLYRILDTCIDESVGLIDNLDHTMVRLEKTIIDDPDAHMAHEIFRLRTRLQHLHRRLSSGRDLLAKLSHENLAFNEPHEIIYFTDVHDHAARVVEALESARDNLRSLLDLQATQRTARLNEIMKTLTIFSTVFLPLTFITGIYGMNFVRIPELHWPFGYAYFWALVVVITSAMLFFFKKRAWW